MNRLGDRAGILLKFVLFFPILTTLVLLSPWSYVYLFLAPVSLLGLASRLQRNRPLQDALVFFIGLSTPLLPGLFPHALLLIVFVYLSIFAQVRFAEWRLILPLFALAFLWVVSGLVFSFDYAAWFDATYQSAETISLWDWLKHYQPIEISRVIELGKYVALAGLFFHFRSHPEFRPKIIYGLFCGLLLATVLLLLQVSRVAPEFLINTSPYWISLNRYSASFSDPNAYGVFVAVIVPLYIGWVGKKTGDNKLFFIILGILAVSGATFSGSRSLFLGIGFLLLLYVYQYLGRLLFTSILMGMLIGVFCLNYLGGPVFIEWLMHLPHLPVGVRRVVETLAFHHMESALSSRMMFLDATLGMFSAYSFVGVGFDAFREYLPDFLRVVSGNNQLWLDNANNFYLGFLAELGLVGAALLSFLLCRVRLSTESAVLTSHAKKSLMVFAVLLFVGPHLEFEEIAVLCSVVLSYAITTSSVAGIRFDILPWLVFLIAVPFVLNHQRARPWGVYTVERTADGREYYWTARQAQVSFDCHDGYAYFRIRSLNPHLNGAAQKVKINSKVYSVKMGEFKDISINCGTVPGKELITIDVEPAWVPAFNGSSEDYRLLGIQVWPGRLRK